MLRLLGTPDHIVYQDRNAPYWYDVESDMLGRLAVFFDDDGVVETMSISPLYRVLNPLLLEDVVRQYGKPNVIQLLAGFEGQRFERFGLVYLDRGLRVGAQCVTSACEIIKRDIVVGQKWYFEPTTLAEYQAIFSSQNPAYEPAYIQWHGFDE